MSDLGLRLQKARSELLLSQEYVAKQLNISRTAVSLIELGKRKVSSDELAVFSRLYGVSPDELLSGHPVEMPSQIFARRFQELDELDQNEILNLMEFKRIMKARSK